MCLVLLAGGSIELQVSVIIPPLCVGGGERGEFAAICIAMGVSGVLQTTVSCSKSSVLCIGNQSHTPFPLWTDLCLEGGGCKFVPGAGNKQVLFFSCQSPQTKGIDG